MAATRKPKQKAAPKPAAAVRDKRDVGVVREYLRSLADKGTGKQTIDRCSTELNVPVQSLRSFRDGVDGAISRGLVTTISKLLGSDSSLTGYTYPTEAEPGDPYSIGNMRMMAPDEQGRDERMRLYNEIDRTRPEASSALDAWADLGITGGVSQALEGFYYAQYLGDDPKVKQALDEISHQINTYVFPNEKKMQVLRQMCKMGDAWGEVGLTEVDGRWDISQLAPRNPRTMFLNRNDDGELIEEKPYVQRLPGTNQTEPLATFKSWQIARFSNMVEWGASYGRSIFEPCLRSYIQLEAMEVAMIIRRLTRAPMRYHHILDVGHVPPDQIETVINDRKQKQRKVRVVDTDAKRGMMSISLPPEEDLYSGKRDKDSPADIQPLAGDANLNDIADFAHFFHKWLAGLGPPKAHLGYESDTMRSVITDLHIVFARKVRRMMLHFMTGLNHLYTVGLILRGIDPRKVRYLIVPPSMGTRDEMVQAQIEQSRSTAMRNLATGFGMTGKVPSTKWFLKHVLKFNDEAIASLEETKVVDLKAGDEKTDPATGTGASNKEDVEDPELATQMLQDDQTAKEVALARILVDDRMQTLRPCRETWGNHNLMPVGLSVDAVCRDLGIRHLF